MNCTTSCPAGTSGMRELDRGLVSRLAAEERHGGGVGRDRLHRARRLVVVGAPSSRRRAPFRTVRWTRDTTPVGRRRPRPVAPACAASAGSRRGARETYSVDASISSGVPACRRRGPAGGLLAHARARARRRRRERPVIARVPSVRRSASAARRCRTACSSSPPGGPVSRGASAGHNDAGPAEVTIRVRFRAVSLAARSRPRWRR